MSFNFPFGLLLLLAIPVLIIIYIIKNKYKEKVISSSYIWDLSKKFLKKKNPLNSIANLLNLIIQCVCIAFLSFSLADPVFNFQNSAENEVYILDASASMKALNENGETRFVAAKNQIKELVNDTPNGSTYTLIVSDSNSRTLCKNIEDKDIFISLLDRVEIDYGESELENAISLAQSLASVGEGSNFSLFTDKDIKIEEGIKAINVSDTTKNYAISDLRIDEIEEEEVPYILLEADVISFSEDTSLTVEFIIDETSLGTVEEEVKQNETKTFSLKVSNIDKKYDNYSSFKATILNEDYLKDDSEFILYNTSDFDTTNILIVSNSPFYFESVFNALNNNKVKITYSIISPYLYSLSGGTVGYDVVIFDGYSPEKLPADSAVWLFNCGETIPNSGFYFQKEFTVDDPGINATYANNNDDILYQELTKDLVKREITIKTYLRYTLNSKFTTILSYDNLPFIFAGRNEFNQKEIVFNFDLHNSNLPLLADFIIMMRNFISYSNPSILSDFNYISHDEVTFTFPDTALSCKILTPSGRNDYLNAYDLQNYNLEEVGTYSINVELATGKNREINIFSSFPLSERNLAQEDTNTYSILLDENMPKADRIFEGLIVVLVVSLVFLLTDWILYSHEQF